MAAELAEGEGALAAEIVRQLDAAAQAQVAARTGAGDGAEAQNGAGRDEQRGIHWLCDTIQAQRGRRAGHGHYCIGVEAQGRAAHGDFQRGGTFVIAEQAVAQAQGAVVHRA
ncbi:hypothetical protein D3C78_1412720 [compost metagenome]